MKGFNKKDYLSVMSGTTMALIRIDDIEYIERRGRKTYIQMGHKRYTTTEKIQILAEELAGRAFFRSMDSLIINFDRVERMEADGIYFVSGHVFSMGKNNMAKTRRAYKKYLLRFPPYSTMRNDRRWDIFEASKVADQTEEEEATNQED